MVAATDYIRAFADQIRPYVPRRYRVLGTDGFGRSDYRARLRRFFEVDRYYVAVAALKSLADEEQIPASRVDDAIKKYDIDPEKPNRRRCNAMGVAGQASRFPTSANSRTSKSSK